MTFDDATRRQIIAARPDASTWLSANAGSGKTRVLTDRVARLLLGGVRPEHILCLTYTKAAASEMQNRLFRRLGAWAMLSEAKLRLELEALGVPRADLSQDDLRNARTLFARAIEAPGGLRIQTIHSFCASLLRRFPMEARISPQFAEMEDRAAELLRAEVLDRMSSGPEAPLVADLAAHLTADAPEPLLAALSRMKAQVMALTPEDIRTSYGIAEGFDEAAAAAMIFTPGTEEFVAHVAQLCRAHGSGQDLVMGERLGTVRGTGPEAVAALEDAVLTGKKELRKKFFNKALAEGPMAPHLAEFDALADRVVAAREASLALSAVRRDMALMRFGQSFLALYEREKQKRGWLDFDDLIIKARDLLSDPAVAAWVLYRLDGGIDHILVDEAQDTSPAQWQVIERLAQEITAGSGARADVRRTIFVVGDKKQSIYSFQGADPGEFDRMRADFAERLRLADAPLAQDVLQHSFRSAAPILQVVDRTFVGRDAAGFGADQSHRAFHETMPGRVDLWPVVQKTQDDEDGPWYEPVDLRGQQHHSVLLARRIAGFIRDTIGTPLPGAPGDGFAPRPIHAGDFLILVRSRKRLFQEIIRACKQFGLPIAGADRLKVTAELAVRDIGALLSFLSTPEDDLALATALRSPLFDCDEQALFDLAHRRPAGRFLWEALRGRRDSFGTVLDVLDDLRGQTDFLRPYDLIERILTRHRGRARLLGRLGEEAEDGINALLQQALAYEQSDVPSLTGFLEWMQSDDLQIKRAPDAAGSRIRVMTIHGAKGLEAPIVILPDCARQRAPTIDDLLEDAGGLLWRRNAESQPERHRAAGEAARQRAEAERDRLLYVAMTRAEKWLVVAAGGDLDEKAGSDWYSRILAALRESGAVAQDFAFDDGAAATGLRLSAGWPQGARETAGTAAGAGPELPAHFARRVAPPGDGQAILSPSDLGGAKALTGPDNEDEDAAKRRGTLIHYLLEHLPRLAPGARADGAFSVLRTAEEGAPDAAALVAEALAVIERPEHAGIFHPDTLAEVAVSATLGPGGARLSGIIDRVIVTDATVTAVDFKTNRTVPDRPEDIPEGFLRQLGAYHAALGQIYPGRRIETAILWTRPNRLMPVPQDLVTAALARIAAP